MSTFGATHPRLRYTTDINTCTWVKHATFLRDFCARDRGELRIYVGLVKTIPKDSSGGRKVKTTLCYTDQVVAVD